MVGGDGSRSKGGTRDADDGEVGRGDDARDRLVGPICGSALEGRSTRQGGESGEGRPGVDRGQSVERWDQLLMWLAASSKNSLVGSPIYFCMISIYFFV
jgi:hypothetical protein